MATLNNKRLGKHEDELDKYFQRVTAEASEEADKFDDLDDQTSAYMAVMERAGIEMDRASVREALKQGVRLSDD